MFVQYVPVLRRCNFPYIFYVELWELEGVVGCCNNYFDKSVGAVRSLLHVLGFSVCNITPFGIIVLEKTYIFSSFSFNISQSHNWLYVLREDFARNASESCDYGMRYVYCKLDCGCWTCFTITMLSLRDFNGN